MDGGRLDVLVAGGGMAGLSAALWLARYRRRVLVCDAGPARNEAAWAVHGYPGLRDPAPAGLLATVLDQAREAGAEVIEAEVTSIRGTVDEFAIEHSAGRASARRVVLAYGLRDYLPDLRGLPEFYGVSVFHCPDCDGPSVTGKRVGVLGADRHAARLALFLVTWSPDVTLLTNGGSPRLRRRDRAVLDANGVRIAEEAITAAVGADGRLTGVQRADRGTLPFDALFFHLGSEPRCDLASDLGCRLDRAGYLRVDAGQQTSVEGVHAAGDIAGHPHLAITAAADGVRAALSIHRSLLPAERQLR